jgi:hypothetical protein
MTAVFTTVDATGDSIETRSLNMMPLLTGPQLTQMRACFNVALGVVQTAESVNSAPTPKPTATP